jgi:hypothetical protein
MPPSGIVCSTTNSEPRRSLVELRDLHRKVVDQYEHDLGLSDRQLCEALKLHCENVRGIKP